MADRECSHQNVIEADELVCTDCGLVLGQVFQHNNVPTNADTSEWQRYNIKAPAYSSRLDDDGKLRETIANALSRMFLDSDSLIEEAVNSWKFLSQFRNVETCVGRRRLAYVLWDSLMSRGVIRKKEDIEAVCGARAGDIASLEKKCPKTRVYKPPSSYIDTIGAWTGMPYRHRRQVTRYMRTFEDENSYLTQDPELLAAASLLYVCGRLKKRKINADTTRVSKSGANETSKDFDLTWELPEYMQHITPKSIASLVDTDINSLKTVYNKVKRGNKWKNNLEFKKK